MSEDFERNERSDMFSKPVRAGKRTYFFDVKSTKGNDYYLTITESRKRFDDNGYDRHKVFLYKEDFNKFVKALNEAVDYVKTELMPDFDFDAFNHDEAEEGVRQDAEVVSSNEVSATENPIPVVTEATPIEAKLNEDVDKW